MTEAISTMPDEDLPSGLAIIVLIALVVLYLISGCDAAREGHHKRSLLKAYKRRHQWKKADIPRLRKLGVSTDALRRIERIESDKLGGRGRGVVDNVQNFGEALGAEAAKVWALIAPSTPPRERLSALRQSELLPEVAEAMYRGEYALAKKEGRRSPAELAEQRAAACLGISPARLHKLCGKARRDRRSSEKAGEPAPISADEFEIWTVTGGVLGHA